jgi:hypothetical protein
MTCGSRTGTGRRAATVMNRWLRELPVSGAPSPRTWRTYAQVLKAWVEFLDARGFRVFGDRRQLREALSAYAEHRLSGPAEARLAPASWNQAVKTLSAFYTSPAIRSFSSPDASSDRSLAEHHPSETRSESDARHRAQLLSDHIETNGQWTCLMRD